MSRSGVESWLVPLLDLVMLARRTVQLRLALLKAELRVRASSLVTAGVLGAMAMVLVVIMLGLLVQAGLLWLALLGLTPLQSLLTGAGVCALAAVVLVLVAGRLVKRATLPLSPLAGSGETRPATRP
ncbi:phage holin family protein [Pseudorhodobacter sp. MZDSW-24AT]|uniref:phage holin family protein n=1 Tax=Pseudorhodobacter sp. MZDSW-24AT TaxID=2052957 RepID=UPI000C1EDD09|nr:phage holin family protein [Pseudorhodobacter sp. MZDSW-24AT]PJF11070.1 hypothetical protein CUR21_00195 [Pseudorhodobacter sp. MZDSW-24AT]